MCASSSSVRLTSQSYPYMGKLCGGWLIRYALWKGSFQIKYSLKQLHIINSIVHVYYQYTIYKINQLLVYTEH